MMDDLKYRTIYLGTVERMAHPGMRHPHAQLKPCFQAISTGDSGAYLWQRIEDIREDFPNRGLVIWFDPSDEASQGTIWQFRIEDQRNFDRNNPSHDAYQCQSRPLPPTEILDLRH